MRAEIRADDAESLGKLRAACVAGGPSANLTLGQFVDAGRVRDRLVLTTYHSSKGRQFEVVILPAMQDGAVPQRFYSNYYGRFSDLPPDRLAEERRLFYVGLTRAKSKVYLLYSDRATDAWGNVYPPGPSRFVAEVQQRLAEET